MHMRHGLAAFTLLLAACSAGEASYTGDPAAQIAAVEEAQLDAIAADDAAGAAAPYAEDATVTMGDEVPIQGIDAIRVAYEEALSDPYFDYVVTPGTLEVNDAKDRAVAVERYTAAASPPEGEGVIVTTGTVETVWAREDGLWHITSLTTAQDPPEVPASAEAAAE